MELLVYLSLLTLLTVSTMKVLGNAAIIRGAARERAKMLLIAQTQLDAARRLPAGELKAGESVGEDIGLPPSMTVMTRYTPREDGTWLVDVVVSRETIEGLPSVSLSTIRGGTP